MIHGVKIEICAGSIEDCITASRFPVDRIELNSGIELGGLTPSLGTLRLAKQRTALPICCMVRPRTAGFVYTTDQFESMLTDATLLLEENADGIVFGFLQENDEIDTARTIKMVELIHSYGKEAVFHRAIEQTPDIEKALQTLIACNVDRVLMSGLPDLLSGIGKLTELISKYDGRIQIRVGGGITEHTVAQVLTTNVRQIHMTAKEYIDQHGQFIQVSPVNLKNTLTNMKKNHG